MPEGTLLNRLLTFDKARELLDEKERIFQTDMLALCAHLSSTLVLSIGQLLQNVLGVYYLPQLKLCCFQLIFISHSEHKNLSHNHPVTFTLVQ